MSQSQYFQDVSHFISTAKGAVNNFTRKVAISALNSVVLKNPVKTGRSRASWTIIPGTSANLNVAPEDSAGIASTRAAQPGMIAALKPGPEFVIANNVHYINLLENGHSKQAPNGMVRVTIAELAARIRANAI